MTEPKTPQIAVRIDAKVKKHAMKRAESEGTNLSEKMREWLEHYAKTGLPLPPR